MTVTKHWSLDVRQSVTGVTQPQPRLFIVSKFFDVDLCDPASPWTQSKEEADQQT